MKKLNIVMCLVLLSILIFTGCTEDSTEIDDQVYTLMIGADKGVNNKVRVTVQFPVYKSGGGDSAGGSSKKSSGSGSEGNKEDTGEVSGTIVETVEAPSTIGIKENNESLAIASIPIYDNTITESRNANKIKLGGVYGKL